MIALTVTGLAIVAPAASAAPGPIQTPTSGMVTAEGLPTVQINGVVWSQAIVGNKVFAGGNFSSARPAGSPAGTNETPRSYLLAYDLTTGALDTSFAPVLNGQVRAVTASPDGSRIYVGGDFTTVNGTTTHARIAAFDTATGSLIPTFLASADYTVNAIAATNTKVYIGGGFNTARGVARSKLAAFAAADGAVTGWNPSADGRVNALAITPGGSRVIVGGAFTYLAGKASYGSGSVDAVAGNALTWNANATIRDYGANSAILGLSIDSGGTVYANGYVYNGTGNLEGVFSADQLGNIRWIEDCHGDSYGTFPSPDADGVYVVSHAHYCGNVGGQPQTDPWSYQRAMAYTKSVTGTLTNNGDAAYANFSGKPSPSIINWFPQIAIGSFTGQSQGAWTVTGNSQYVVLGGEFPSINGVAQQGIVRFAVQPISNGTKPVLSGANMVPSIQALNGGTVRVSVTTNWDRDDSLLTYQLLRNGQVANSTVASSTFWNRPKVTLTDTGLTNGTTYSYQFRTIDSGGNAAVGNPVTYKATATVAPFGPFAKLVASQGPSAYWRLGEGSGTVFDWAGSNDGTAGSGVTRGVAGAIPGDPNAAASFNGTDNGRMSTKNAIAGPQIYSVEAFFKTSTKTGGKLIGFGTSATGSSGSYDRQIYMANNGQLFFGNYNGNVSAISSPKSYNDGQWHQVVGTLSLAGAVLYVDGVQVASNPAITSAQAYTGYWRLGGDNIAAWPSAPSSQNFNGTLDEVSVYPMALTGDQVLAQYNGSGVGNVLPTASFTVSNVNRAVTLDASASNDPDGSIASYAWDYGNGQTGTGVNSTYTYPADGTYTIKLTVTDNKGATMTTSKSVTVAANKPPVAQFTTAVNNLAVTVNGTASSDPDGTVASYAWNFGDGGTDTGATPSAHAYAAAGVYPVTLTVTDNQGLATSSTTNVAVNAPGTPAVFATDSFARSVTGGFGNADVGGAWTTVGAASGFAVANGTGASTMATKGATQAAYLNSISRTDVDITVDLALDKVANGNGINLSAAARHVGTADYRMVTHVAANGNVDLQPIKIVNGVQTNLATAVVIAGLTYSPGDTLRMRFQVSGTGTATLNGKVWKVGTTEPSTWQVTTTDSSAELQGAGSVGLVAFLSALSSSAPVVASFDNLTVQAVQ